MLRRAVLTLVIGSLTLAFASAGASAQDDDGRPEKPLTTLEVRGIAPPQVVKGTDGRRHVEYDLAITNVFTADVTLTSLEVRDVRGGLPFCGSRATRLPRSPPSSSA